MQQVSNNNQAQDMQQERPKFFDPHFHIFDKKEGPHADEANPSDVVFKIKDYEGMVQNDRVEMIGGVFIEVLAKQAKRIEEAQWADEMLNESERTYGLVAGINLKEDITNTLAENKKLTRFRGFRNCIAYDESGEDRLHVAQAPDQLGIDPEITENYLLNETVRQNFKVMEAEDVTFDLFVYPNQYQQAADVLQTVPNLRVIINHRGLPQDIESLQSERYWAGMKRLAAMSNVYMKISMFGQTDPKWENGDIVTQQTVELIKLFTPEKCMFATNFPVDGMPELGSWTIDNLIDIFITLASEFTPQEQDCLWRETAQKAYRITLE